ncbi:MAG TPA: peptidoglycan-binding domain-containing protein [Solirubrobacteraceae bacterium]|nr:peptidoglycan-binding domain-containing protein [Solirubrobacteraceae bacterium]
MRRGTRLRAAARRGRPCAAAIVLLAFCAPAAGAEPSPLRAPSLWIAHAGEPAAIAAQARPAGVRTLLVKAADGTTPDPQFTPALVSALRASGLSVCAWTFAYGTDPAGEAAAAVAAVRAGAQCLVVDAEGQYDSRYGQAQLFVRSLRGALGRAFPIALAGQAETLQHPKFPYSVFLGPGAFQLDMPQAYWHDLGLTPGAAVSVAIGENALYGRPIVPVGQLYGGVGAAEVGQFATFAAEHGSPGASFFDLDSAEPALLAAVVPHVAPAIRLAARPATVRPGADGDEVLWAQELLNGAGAHLPAGGFFGAQTGRALVRFQAHHRLARTGVLDAPTWRALLRVRPRVPSWAKRPPDSAL